MRHFRICIVLFGFFSLGSICLMQRSIIYSLKIQNSEIKRLAAEVLVRDSASLWTTSHSNPQTYLSLLEEPSYVSETPSFEEKSKMLREHLLLSNRPDDNEPPTARLLISPDWMMSVLDSADREVQDLKLQLESKHSTSSEKRMQTTLGSCPYIGTSRTN